MTAALVRKTALLAVLLIAIYRWLKQRRSRPRGAPFVDGHWLLGSLPDITAAMKVYGLHDWWVKNHKKYGKTLVVRIPMQPYVVNTTDPKVIEHVLKTNFDNYAKGHWFRERLTDLLGNGIFNVDGAMWHSQRKISSHMFTQNQFKNHIWHVIGQNCEKVVKLLRDTPEGKVVNLFDIMNRFTLDTIGSIGFARDIGSLANASSPFLKSFDRAQQIAVTRFIFPFWKINRFLGTGLEREAKDHFKLLTEYSMETIQNLKEDPTGEKGNSFVGMFIQDAAKKGEAYDDVFLKDMVLNFLIAGRDTTAQALSWIFWLLMGHPKVEAKIMEEIKDVLNDLPITYENSAQLKYLQNVINEGIRLYPSVPEDSKIALRDDTLPDGTFVPKDCVVQYSPYAMGRSTELWGPDAEDFRPERWEGRDFPSSFIYPAFNAGPRECLGKRLAWVEMRACLAEVLRNVTFELAVPRDAVKQDMQLTIGMSSGLPCTVKAR